MLNYSTEGEMGRTNNSEFIEPFFMGIQYKIILKASGRVVGEQLIWENLGKRTSQHHAYVA